MNTYEYVLNKFNLSPDVESPVKLVFKRYDLAGLFKELGFKTGAEVGVYRGQFSEVLCVQNPGLKLSCIDPWQAYEDAESNPETRDQKTMNGFYEETKARLAPYKCQIIREPSLTAVKGFAPNGLDFVYIDGNHNYQGVSGDLEAWSKVVRPGGIVSGHDYGHYKHKDLGLESKRAIDEFVAKHKIKKLFLVNRNSQTSWFFVKE